VIRIDWRGTPESVALITLDRAERRNALDATHWAELAATVRNAVDHSVGAIVITGAGTCFCAGGDLDEPDFHAMSAACNDSLTAITRAPMPVIAAINGPALGAGVPLVLSCDLKVASPAARFAIPAAAISRPVNPTVVAWLVAQGGLGTARTMLLGGEELDAVRAERAGIINRMGDLDAALTWAEQIAKYAPLVLERFKADLRSSEQDSPTFSEFVQRVLTSDDYAEAAKARAERREPRYTGR
jgi:enoyl-CoA hydratase